MSINDRADLFSGDVMLDNAYPATLEKIPELQEQSIKEGFYRGYLRPLIPSFLKRAPQLSDQFQQLQRNAIEISNLLNRQRAVEEQVLVNGRLLPGIFIGIRLNGGILRQKIRAKSRTNKKIKGIDISKEFSIDKGDRPVTGSASFIMLDDYYSTAKSKAVEFFRIITDWRVGEANEKEGRDRIFTMRTFISGEGWPGPLNFSRIKILNWGVDMDNEGLEGSIACSFEFEQYEKKETEGQLRKPKTPGKNEGGGTVQPETPASLPSDLSTFKTGL